MRDRSADRQPVLFSSITSRTGLIGFPQTLLVLEPFDFWGFLSTFAVAVPGFAFCSVVCDFAVSGGVLCFYFAPLFFLKGKHF